jgi:acetylornithine deacetylase/succinyl-diaminopimelate desuccinylase-like protein
LNSKSFKNTQKIFRRRLREIAAGGNIHAEYKEDDYCAGEYIKGWLRNLGFTVKQVDPIRYEITWPRTER